MSVAEFVVGGVRRYISIQGEPISFSLALLNSCCMVFHHG
ncbi:hypothetical protein GCHA_3053 [Paraglaciecola chathamensis S18K6]|uniref:Uncharacterized protein n=1 Tax=Paraglaciecola chathamensis S18K6 TaxID=1127672 RepID=A0AAV3V387_9ALTE|nr:hypothetical protein GCHA_3053 [Paraglaciecola chathamensis S18K6]